MRIVYNTIISHNVVRYSHAKNTYYSKQNVELYFIHRFQMYK